MVIIARLRVTVLGSTPALSMVKGRCLIDFNCTALLAIDHIGVIANSQI